ncbi:RNA-binding S4 domain-containing protein [Rhodobacter sp. NSM]|uniref:RNA-binding S4 domain-containing protein n=1 Tax=Rhodobacter sp. NSM TaxID=3457501 RepID=UPI003FD10BA7
MGATDRATIRLDKWLVQARFFKTRALATAVVEAGRVRLNGQHVAKPSHPVGEGDTLTFPQGSRIRVIRVRACGTRRGPAAEAQSLYVDLDAPPAAASPLE